MHPHRNVQINICKTRSTLISSTPRPKTWKTMLTLLYRPSKLIPKRASCFLFRVDHMKLVWFAQTTANFSVKRFGALRDWYIFTTKFKLATLTNNLNTCDRSLPGRQSQIRFAIF